MAFVYKAKRFKEEEHPDYLGPGSYEHNLEGDGRKSYAPFGST